MTNGDRMLSDMEYSPAWDRYECALDAARAARGFFFRRQFSVAGRNLKGRLCPRLEKWHIHWCQ